MQFDFTDLRERMTKIKEDLAERFQRKKEEETPVPEGGFRYKASDLGGATVTSGPIPEWWKELSEEEKDKYRHTNIEESTAAKPEAVEAKEAPPKAIPTPVPEQEAPGGQEWVDPSIPEEISGVIDEVFGDLAIRAKQILRWKDEEGKYGGENQTFDPTLDIPNRTKYDPKSGEQVWNNDPDAPIDQIVNPFTKEQEDSLDRGLFRINNETFYTYLRDKREGYREAMYKAGIIDEPHDGGKGLTPEKVEEYWGRMLDTEMNIKMARIIYDKQGAKAWVARPKHMAMLEKSLFIS